MNKPTTKPTVEEIELLKEERDEARREICGIMQLTGFLAGDYARERGWVFSGMSFLIPQSVRDFDAVLNSMHERQQNRIEILRTERDEARRMYCECCRKDYDSSNIYLETAKSIAAYKGWDCFRESNNE